LSGPRFAGPASPALCPPSLHDALPISPIWVLLSGKAVNRDDLGQGTVWVIMNITQRKQLEEQLQKTNSEREAILNSAHTVPWPRDRKSTRLNSSHLGISYAVFCLKKKG